MKVNTLILFVTSRLKRGPRCSFFWNNSESHDIIYVFNIKNSEATAKRTCNVLNTKPTLALRTIFCGQTNADIWSSFYVLRGKALHPISIFRAGEPPSTWVTRKHLKEPLEP
jgi:hypothetical protein